jgi:hypothetical protein
VVNGGEWKVRAVPVLYHTTEGDGGTGTLPYCNGLYPDEWKVRAVPVLYHTTGGDGGKAQVLYHTAMEVTVPKEFEMVIKSSTLAHTEFYPFGFE